MNRDVLYSDINEALPSLASILLDEGNLVGSRLGEQTKELTFVGITLANPLNREILLPTRKASLAAQIAESMWVLSGRDDIAWLSHYLPRAKDFSDDGEVWRGAYGPRLRRWPLHNGPFISQDQLAHVVGLLKEEPTTRRAVMSIYDPARDAAPGKDIPCNDFLHFLARDGIVDLHVFTRSNDILWGWSGINAFEWSVLLEVVAGLTGLKVGQIHFSISSLHVYDRHFQRLEKLRADNPVDPFKESPRFKTSGWVEFNDIVARWFDLENSIRTALMTVSAETIRDFPDPMLRSWLQVIAYHWSGNPAWLQGLNGTPLYHAAMMSPVPPHRKPVQPAGTPFTDFVARLHEQKHAAYGDSWKKRGELFSIIPNVARKVDRLGVSDDNETAADTAIDLLVYLIKYRIWLVENEVGTPLPAGLRDSIPEAHVDQVAKVLRYQPTQAAQNNDVKITYLKMDFESLMAAVENKEPDRWKIVDRMLVDAGPLAARLWDWEQRDKKLVGRTDEPEEQMHARFDSRMSD